MTERPSATALWAIAAILVAAFVVIDWLYVHGG